MVELSEQEGIWVSGEQGVAQVAWVGQAWWGCGGVLGLVGDGKYIFVQKYNW